MSLVDAFLSLPRPQLPGSYTSVHDTGQRCRVARSYQGHPCLLLRFDSEHGISAGRSLATLSYRPPAVVHLISTDGAEKSSKVAILECKTTDSDVIRYFYRVMASVVVNDERTAKESVFERALDAIISLFRALQRPARKSIQGLWAELALIAWSEDPSAAVAAWHSDPEQLHDFAAGSFRVEVKSTLKTLREHAVGLDQLSSMSPGRTLLVSFQLREAIDGASIEDLISAILPRLADHSDSRARLEIVAGESLGSDWRSASEIRFALCDAREKLRVYWGDEVPSVAQPLPPEIKEVRFVVDLSSTRSIALSAARSVAPLFASLLPAEHPK